MKSKLKGGNLIFLLLLPALALAGCKQRMSYEEASKMEPYRSIADSADRQWLYEYHQKPAGALNWLEDEIRMQDKNIGSIWYTSDGLFELEDITGSDFWSIKRSKAISLVKEKGGAAAAREIVTLARKEMTGGYPSPPEKPSLYIGLSNEHRRAQKLRYPDLYAATVIEETQPLIEEAKGTHKAGDAERTQELIGDAIDIRRGHLGNTHPATVEALNIFQYVAGRPYDQPPAARTATK